MIQMYSNDRLLIGVTRANIDRLVAGLPVSVAIVEPVSHLYIMFGEDKLSILQQLKQAGIAVPPALELDVERDPT